MKRLLSGLKWMSAILSRCFLALAVLLYWYSLYGFSHFEFYNGYYSDSRLIMFDNAIYPATFGTLFLLAGFILRLRYIRLALTSVALSALLVLSWKRLTAPPLVAGYELFPDKITLEIFIALALVFLFLAFIDKYIQRGIDYICGKSSRLQKNKDI